MAVSGKVVHYDTNRGFGFLAPESGGADVFLHINDIDIDEQSLKPGAKVSFDIEETDRGAKAINVAVIEEASGDDAPASRPSRRDSHEHHGRAHNSDRDRDRGRRPRGGSLESSAFTEEITELLLDSADDLTAAQIIAIRQRITEFAVARGWVLD
ncbi:MAG: cold shock domain-containing protein [Gordonia sp. (in: high G+C Gram-positive bacteria)]